MFNNPNTIWLEILIITVVIAFLGLIIGRHIYKRIKHIPTACDCGCHKNKKQLLKEYHACCCNKDHSN